MTKGKTVRKLDAFDIRKLCEAKEIVRKVHEYYYGSPNSGMLIRRLETIMGKLDYLINMGKEEAKRCRETQTS